jgi:hypothetical protein
MDINSTSQYFPFRGKKGALDSQPQVIKFTSCLPMIGGSKKKKKKKYNASNSTPDQENIC